MAHILVRTPATISHTWEIDGTPTDPAGDTTTIRIVRDNGTELVAAGTSTTHAGQDTGTFTFPLTTVHTAELDRLTATWTATFSGQQVSVPVVYEIVGGHLFTERQLRAHQVGDRTPFASTTDYPNDRIMDVRAQVTDDFAGILQYSPIPRYARERLDGSGTDTLVLSHQFPRRILTLAVNGTAFDATALADLDVDPAGVITRLTLGWFARGRRNVDVAYVHGGDQAYLAQQEISFGELSTAAVKRTAMLLDPALSSTVSSYTTQDGSTYSFDPAGRRIGQGDTQWYGVPAIDSVLNRSRRPKIGVG